MRLYQHIAVNRAGEKLRRKLRLIGHDMQTVAGIKAGIQRIATLGLQQALAQLRRQVFEVNHIAVKDNIKIDVIQNCIQLLHLYAAISNFYRAVKQRLLERSGHADLALRLAYAPLHQLRHRRQNTEPRIIQINDYIHLRMGILALLLRAENIQRNIATSRNAIHILCRNQLLQLDMIILQRQQRCQLVNAHTGN